jgi:hypothetical protein
LRPQQHNESQPLSASQPTWRCNKEYDEGRSFEM